MTTAQDRAQAAFDAWFVLAFPAEGEPLPDPATERAAHELMEATRIRVSTITDPAGTRELPFNVVLL